MKNHRLCRGGACLLPAPETRRWNRKISIVLAALLTVAALPLAGCWEGPGADRVRWAVERQLPGTRYD
ncbi:MAG: hypothetical protein ACLF0P_12765, partial [Thermoanaerobaculia bacterium]